MTKVNTTVKIKCADENLAKVLFGYIRANGGEMKRGIDSHLRSQGAGLTDVTLEKISPETLTMTLSSNPTDKGEVFITGEDGKLYLEEYKSLEDESFYGIIDGGRVLVYQYAKETPDKPIAAATDTGVLVEMLTTFPLQFIAKKKRRDEVTNANISKAAAEHANMKVLSEEEVLDYTEDFETVEETKDSE